jgi:hypothetical protein
MRPPSCRGSATHGMSALRIERSLQLSTTAVSADGLLYRMPPSTDPDAMTMSDHTYAYAVTNLSCLFGPPAKVICSHRSLVPAPPAGPRSTSR